jgi:poly(A) polymerase
MLLGAEPADHDVTTDAAPERVEELFPRTFEVGRQFGVMTVIESGVHVEVATFRTDGSYSDGRRPDSVEFADARGDVARRDFTVNAILYDPLTDEYIDHVGGRADIAARLLRTVGDPRERFQEDRLRMLRAARFAARLGFALDPATAQACLELAPLVTSVSPERIRDELGRMLGHASRGRAFRLLDELGLLAPVLPEVAACRGVRQPPNWHPEGDVLTHVFLALEKLRPDSSADVAWGVLLHDIGKPGTFDESEGRIRFHGHDALGARMTREVAGRLRFSNAATDRITWLVARHLWLREAKNMNRSTLRRVLAEAWIDDLVTVCRADALAGSGDVSHLDFLEAARAEFGSELPPPLINGTDLRAAGLPPGRAFARILELVRTEQLEGRLPTREDALERVRALVAGEMGAQK